VLSQASAMCLPNPGSEQSGTSSAVPPSTLLISSYVLPGPSALRDTCADTTHCSEIQIESVKTLKPRARDLNCVDTNTPYAKAQTAAIERTFAQNLSVQVRVANEGQSLAVRRPGRNVHGPLPSIHVSDDFRRASFDWHHAKINLFVIRVVGRIYIF
jgi:hypothetical protein